MSKMAPEPPQFVLPCAERMPIEKAAVAFPPATLSSAPKSARARASQATPQIPLPFAEKEFVDAPRAAAILGVSHRRLLELSDLGVIEVIDYRRRGRKRVRYASIVALCDGLREQFSIEDRRPALPSPIFRHRDADLLPFPLSDTISLAETKAILGFENEPPVFALIQRGCFDAYQIQPAATWRISASSVAAFIERSKLPRNNPSRRAS